MPAGSIPQRSHANYVRCEPDSKQADSHLAKNLVLCFDGTGDTFSSYMSNLPKLFSLANEDPSRQACYYQTGIGTYEAIYHPSRIWQKVVQLADSAVAFSLDAHVKEGYSASDKLFIFGFSRGAFTARALAGMIQQVGLVPAGNEQLIPLAYSIYKRKGDTILVPGGETLAEGFKRTFSREVYVHFVGVWDTVASVGAIIPKTLPFASGSNYICHFRQAFSLDEHRARYAEQPWIPDESPPLSHSSTSSYPLPHADTTVKEVWFAGAHSNIGGGQFPYDGEATPSLSHLSLRWMVREAVEHGFDLDFDAVRTSPLFAPFLIPAEGTLTRIAAGKAVFEDEGVVEYVHRAKSANPHCNDLMAAVVYLAAKPSPHATADALAPRGDALTFRVQRNPQDDKLGWGGKVKKWWLRTTHGLKALLWWSLEISPTVKVVWDAEGNTRRWTVRSNCGRGRILPARPVFHYSVRTRLEAVGPHAFGPGNDENVPEGTTYRHEATFRDGTTDETVMYVE
ncbi:hypothetical protein JCM5296_000497 [Sporobolomyces johnsonii]